MPNNVDSLFYSVKPWLIALVNLVILVAMSELGFRLGRRRRKATDASQRGQITTLQAAILGFLALILGFTFSISQGRFDTRRQLVIEEANAIGTTWLRSQMLPEPYKSNLSTLLDRYAELRVPHPDIESVSLAITESEYLHEQLWLQAVGAANTVDDPALTILFTQTLNEMIDLHTTRVAAYLYRAPAALLMLLHLTAALALGVMGYASGLDGQRHLFTAAVMVVLVGIVLGLIVDLEQSQSGMFQSNPKPLFDVRDMIEQNAAEQPPTETTTHRERRPNPRHRCALTPATVEREREHRVYPHSAHGQRIAVPCALLTKERDHG